MCVPISPPGSMSYFTDFRIQILAAPLFFPEAYNYWAHLGLEITTNIFWLTTFALLAEEVAGWNIVGDFGFNPFLPRNWNSAIGATKGATALGAINWFLFIVTLVSFGTFAFPHCVFSLSISRIAQKLMVLLLGRDLSPQTPPGTRRRWLRRQSCTSRRREGRTSRHHSTRRIESCPSTAATTAGVYGSSCLGNAIAPNTCTARRSSRRISMSRSLAWRL